MVHAVFIEDTQVVGAAGLESFGGGVRIVAHIPGCLADKGSPFFTVTGQSIQGTGNSRNGNTAYFCNILQSDHKILPCKTANIENVYTIMIMKNNYIVNRQKTEKGYILIT